MKFPKGIITLKKNFIVSQAEGMDSLKEKLCEVCFSLNEQEQHIISLQVLKSGETWRIFILAEGLWGIHCDEKTRVYEPSESPCRTCLAGASCDKLCVNYRTWQKKSLEGTFENMFGMAE